MQMKKYVVLNENIWVDFILQEGFFFILWVYSAAI